MHRHSPRPRRGDGDLCIHGQLLQRKGRSVLLTECVDGELSLHLRFPSLRGAFAVYAPDVLEELQGFSRRLLASPVALLPQCLLGLSGRNWVARYRRREAYRVDDMARWKGDQTMRL